MKFLINGIHLQFCDRDKWLIYSILNADQNSRELIGHVGLGYLKSDYTRMVQKVK